MRSLTIISILLLFFAACSQNLPADENQGPAKDPKKRPYEKSKNLQIVKETEQQVEPKASQIFNEPIDHLEKEWRESFLKARYEHEILSYKHRREVLDWQHTSSIIIFWVVVIIVFVGLIFSGVQFYISMMQEKRKLKEDKIENSETGKNDLTKTEIEASLKGIKVNSSVLGVIILIISLLFLYLYLVHVYPIKEIGGEPKTKVSEKR
ncbi:MAG: hypothetical protein GTO45_38835 [Candidatus Aminicenantes bacterium]|nr:hypothetical protein [Candidatus Aminicenantes bacterium]NIM84580.1 hypothetical protein [Candidatus Aminicenantes bacterium]NIN24102.1 hypothetical protein [Candidatus Aminicenantes bacterium]NIN47808.1 hypothetical protein [Candidatus Aminicenantes bacterium]NIN90746.1 hypothetical protein [Candidatus Aminicenantes bacterium]